MLQLGQLTIRVPDPGSRRRRWLIPVDDLTLTAHTGTVTGVVGESGAGKSMLLAALSGMLPAGAQTSGRCIVDGQPLTGISERRWRTLRGRQIGVMSQQVLFTPVRTVAEQLLEAAPTADLDQLAGDCGLPRPLLNRFPHELSGGELRRAGAISGVLHDPRLILADEPTAGLAAADVTVITRLLRHRAAGGATVVVITHDLDVAEQATDQLIVMRRGQLVDAGPTRQVLTCPAHPYSQALVQARHANGFLAPVADLMPSATQETA